MRYTEKYNDSKSFGQKSQQKSNSDEAETLQNSLLRGVIYCLLALILLLIITTLTGCAMSSTSAQEMTGENQTFRVKITSLATIGAKLQDGSGDVDYKGEDWHFKAGNHAQGLDGGDMGAVFQMFGQLISAGLMRPPAPQQSDGTDITMAEVLEMIRELRATVQELQGAKP